MKKILSVSFTFFILSGSIGQVKTNSKNTHIHYQVKNSAITSVWGLYHYKGEKVYDNLELYYTGYVLSASGLDVKYLDGEAIPSFLIDAKKICNYKEIDDAINLLKTFISLDYNQKKNYMIRFINKHPEAFTLRNGYYYPAVGIYCN